MRQRTTWIAGLLAVVMSLSLSSPTMADSNHDRKKKVDAAIEALKANLDETSASLRDAAIALQMAQMQLSDAQAAVTRAQAALADAQARDAALVARLAVAVAEEDKAQRAMAAVEARIRKEQDNVGEIASAAYRQGSMGQLSVALEADNPDDFANRLVLVQTAMRAGTDAVNELAVAKADLRNSEAVLAAKRAQVAAMREESRKLVIEKQQLTAAAQAAKAKVQQLVAKRATALAAMQREKAAEQKRLAAAQAESRALAKKIAEEAARLARLRASRGGARAVLVPSGSMLFPAVGPISTYAGFRHNPVTGSASCHSGIDIAAGGGAPIRAADNGVVVATVYTSWDGNTTVIDHGGGVTTWYAHQNSFSVHVGQQVSRGQVIGYVGSTGLATGPHLHFNIAINGVAYDPMGWFGGPKRPVASLCPNGPSPVL